MSTALKVYEQNEIAVLNPNSETAIAMRVNMEGETFSETDLIRVKTPSSGGLFWSVPLISGPQSIATLEGVCVFKAYKGLIWPSLQQKVNPSGKKDKPVVITNDLKYGKLTFKRSEVPEGVPEEMMETLDKHEIEGQPGVYDWEKLPYTQWGTGKNGIGKYAKEHQLLFILRKDEALPLFIQVGAGSLKDMRQFFKRMDQLPYYRAVISLSLKEAKATGGEPYSKIVPTLTGKLSPEDGEKILELYTNRLKATHEAGLIDITEDSVED